MSQKMNWGALPVPVVDLSNLPDPEFGREFLRVSQCARVIESGWIAVAGIAPNWWVVGGAK